MSFYRENVQCTQCEAIMINGVYCHETGCPVDSAKRRLRQIEENNKSWLSE